MEAKLGKNLIPETVESLWKPFIIIFAILYIAFNWQNISWLFNYKVAGQYLGDLKPADKQPAVKVPVTSVNVQPEKSGEEVKEQENDNLDDNEPVETDKVVAGQDPVIINPRSFDISIAKLGIKAPIVVSDTADNAIIHKYLDSGVVMYPDSVKPGQNGEIMLLGHSAPPGWPKIKYDWVFSRINELAVGDNVALTYNGKVFNYTVKKTVIILPGEELPASNLDENTLFLISCWPPGKDYKRIVVKTTLME
ncbi:MAG TPA: sortase [Candidatus Paceibacterota bacterium]|nr:sortase [Candidatus Pacearchaeota archaeon]HRZ50576.1 sortase [Candidatus Paceibacterota bacterium]HSA36297.1 sortase [Candidatus Paceibacterota bacterium]